MCHCHCQCHTLSICPPSLCADRKHIAEALLPALVQHGRVSGRRPLTVSQKRNRAKRNVSFCQQGDARGEGAATEPGGCEVLSSSSDDLEEGSHAGTSSESFAVEQVLVISSGPCRHGTEFFRQRRRADYPCLSLRWRSTASRHCQLMRRSSSSSNCERGGRTETLVFVTESFFCKQRTRLTPTTQTQTTPKTTTTIRCSSSLN